MNNTPLLHFLRQSSCASHIVRYRVVQSDHSSSIILISISDNTYEKRYCVHKQSTSWCLDLYGRTAHRNLTNLTNCGLVFFMLSSTYKQYFLCMAFLHLLSHHIISVVENHKSTLYDLHLEGSSWKAYHWHLFSCADGNIWTRLSEEV